MNYYKLLTKEGYPGDCYVIDKIYPEIFKESENSSCKSVLKMQRAYPNDWQEVSAGEYFVQEGVMPKYFAIKRVADNPLWKKYIYWLNNTYFSYITGDIDEYYGFDSRVFIDPKLKYFKNNPVELTLEQWDKIINKTMEEKFKLPEKWCVLSQGKDTYEKYLQPYLVKYGYENPEWNGIDYYYSYIKGEFYADNYPEIRGCVEITFEQFIKHVLKEEVMEEKEEIIGWKLKEDCEQYKQAALNIVNQSKFYNFAEGYNFSTNSSNESDLKKAGVLELWFEPVYKEEFKVGDWVTFYLEYNQRTYTDKIKEWTCHSYCILEGGLEPFKHLLRKATTEEIKAVQTLQFGGYDVTFEKVTSGIRITCNGETGTFSQLDKIYKFATEETRFKFGSANIKSIEYDDGTEWTDDSSDTPVSITIGCTTGTWKEFVTIYEKAKSML